MNLEKNISALLYSNDCVIVPGFGAFLTHKNVSVLEGNSIYPPSKKLGFNSALQKSDGLLIQTVAQQNDLNFDDARREVENQINFWKNHLERNHSLVLNYLGTFTKNESGNIEFSPVEQNYLLDSFGLQKIQARYILQAVTEKPSSNGVWWKVASVVPLLIGGYLYFGKPQPVADFVNEQWSGFVIPLVNPELIKEETPSANTVKVIEENPVITNKKEEIILKDYQVIAGAFRVRSEAEMMESNLKEKGFENAQFTQKKGNYYYVAFETFQTKEAALEYRKTVQEEYPETWVLSLKED